MRDYGTASWKGGDPDCSHKFTVSSPLNANFNERCGNASGSRKQESERHEVAYKGACGKCGARRIDLQLGLEKTPQEYVDKLVSIFREVRRVLRKDGTLWLNLGDSYNANQGAGFDTNQDGGERKRLAASPRIKWGKRKDLVGIPWRVAFALQADGWWLRSDIIWAKPNPMPESVTDRPTKSHEYIFLLTKSANYYFDAEAIKEKATGHPHGNGIHNMKYDRSVGNRNGLGASSLNELVTNDRNKRSVWTVVTAPYPEAHFATYPPDLIKPCILAGTSAKGCCAKCGAPWERIVERSGGSTGKGGWHNHEDDLGRGQHGAWPTGDYKVKTLGWQPTCKCNLSNGHDDALAWREQPERTVLAPATHTCTVLDPFAGSGTTGAVALELGRKAVLIELNPNYCKLIDQRCNVTLGLSLTA